MDARRAGIGSAVLLTAVMLSAGVEIAPIAHAAPAAQQRPEGEQGVALSPEAIDAYNALKNQKKLRYIILKFNDSADRIVVEKTSESTNYDEFTEALQSDGKCRYGIYDLQYEHNGTEDRKIFLINWIPESAKLTERMRYSAGLDTINRNPSVTGATPYNASDPSELEYALLLEKARN
ncbi:actin-binding ADF family protein [Nocardia brasiliensis]